MESSFPKAARDRMSLGVNRWGCASSLAPRAPGKGRWTGWSEGQGYLWEQYLRHNKWKSETIKDGESLFIGWAAAAQCYQWKIKLDCRVRICFHDIFPLDFSKCILGVSQRLFFKNKLHILFSNFILSLISDWHIQDSRNPFCWSELWQ